VKTEIKRTKLPPYTYGREAAVNEHVWTEDAIVRFGEDSHTEGRARAHVEGNRPSPPGQERRVRRGRTGLPRRN
jgi:hypothetical protein